MLAPRDEARPARRLIVNADDFGVSSAANEAIERAHREGMLTSASLMVNEKAADGAVEIARRNPRLGVGLHLTLLCGASALPHARIPGLCDSGGRFSDRSVRSGFRYFFDRSLRSQLEAEMEAQFEAFHRTGLVLDHVNGHLHMHLHPVVFNILMRNAARWKINQFRLTRDSFWLSARMTSGGWLYRASHAAVYWSLSGWARPALARRGIRHAALVFGLLQSGRVDEDYVRRLLPLLPPGDWELYSHPSFDRSPREYAALVSPGNLALVRELGIELVRYQDLSRKAK